jgi:helix-turn-helix protein
MITPEDLAGARLALGQRLAALRRAAGLNQADLGSLALTSRSTVANVERGRQCGTRDFWTRCDGIVRAGGVLLAESDRVRALQRRHFREAGYLQPGGVLDDCDAAGWTARPAAGSTALARDALPPGGGAVPGATAPSAAQPPSGDVVRLQIPAIRCVLDTHDVPQDGPVRALPVLRDDVAALVGMRLQSSYGRLATRLPQLLPELHRALDSAVGQRRTMVAGLLVQAYRAADAVADKFGFYDLSARIIGLMMDAARESGDERAIAAAAYVRAETFFANGQYEIGRRMLERAAQRLMPEAGSASAAAYGALHMRAAVLAARAGTLAKATDHLLEAGSWAHGLPDGVYAGTVFGPASVRIHEVALAVDGGDPDAALTVAARWQPREDLPAERRSHFYIDLARAFAMVDSLQQARDALLTARIIAPEHVHDHPQVRDVLDGLTRSRLGQDTRVQQLWRWVGASGGVSVPVPA